MTARLPSYKLTSEPSGELKINLTSEQKIKFSVSFMYNMDGPSDMQNAKCLLQINFEAGSVMDVECIFFIIYRGYLIFSV